MLCNVFKNKILNEVDYNVLVLRFFYLRIISGKYPEDVISKELLQKQDFL